MKFLFEYLTDSFSLLENPILDCIILAVIGELAFRIAFEWIGDMYRIGIIDGRFAGHVLHWIFRLIIYAVIFYTAATAIKVYYWFKVLPDFKWWILVGIITSIIGIVGVGKYVLHKRNK